MLTMSERDARSSGAMKNKYTPGPWEIKDQTDRPDGFPGKGYVFRPQKSNKVIGLVLSGTDYTYSVETQEANAKLIAAAPELLEALQEIRELLGVNANEALTAMVIAETAIAKATE